ncbi:hypothetical protein ATANTOWER_028779 [Ataeniobius toweri]|uniref:Uncharacterized protein n=1 Tax=Ataeniobius toweri TaxID=208326 RepID=A0ABU7AJF3_9TELE|nr:hypothetical protein [Ataeniobius toweri]
MNSERWMFAFSREKSNNLITQRKQYFRETSGNDHRAVYSGEHVILSDQSSTLLENEAELTGFALPAECALPRQGVHSVGVTYLGATPVLQEAGGYSELPPAGGKCH